MHAPRLIADFYAGEGDHAHDYQRFRSLTWRRSRLTRFVFISPEHRNASRVYIPSLGYADLHSAEYTVYFQHRLAYDVSVAKIQLNAPEDRSDFAPLKILRCDAPFASSKNSHCI